MTSIQLFACIGMVTGFFRKTDGPFRHSMHHVFAGLSPV